MIENLSILYLSTVVMAFIGIWFYTRAGALAQKDNERMLADLVRRVKALESLSSGNVTTISAALPKVQALEADFKAAWDELNRLQEHCARNREAMIALEAQRGVRRSITVFKGPLQVEVLPKRTKAKRLGKGLSSLMKS